jgi:hypothetical protein
LPRIINLLTDLKEERDVLLHSSWVTYPTMKILRDFEASLEAYPPIKPGTPDPYIPPAPSRRGGHPRQSRRRPSCPGLGEDHAFARSET